ncbi:MAG: hypothetical protein R2823_10040 [Acidimicrobiia bacterium]
MAVQTGEGIIDIIYGTTSVPAGPRVFGGYLARPDGAGEWPTVLIYGPAPLPTSTIKDICRVLARHGIAALALDLTDSREHNRSVSRAAAAFVGDPSGEWSNGQLGYGVLAFGAGIGDLVELAHADPRCVAAAIVAATIDGADAELLHSAGIDALAILSRKDASVDLEATRDAQADNPHLAMVIYASGEEGFWDAGTDAFDDARYRDTIDRVIAFFTEQLPPRV